MRVKIMRGGNFYPREYIPAILKNSGFYVEECSIRIDSEMQQYCAQFIAVKE
jgi:hypothetical protein